MFESHVFKHKSPVHHIPDGPEATSTKPFLGYLCETRAIYTSTGSDMCTFPFTYQGKTYTRYQFYKTFLGVIYAPIGILSQKLWKYAESGKRVL